MEEQPCISVLVPARERRGSLRSCLVSLGGQVDPPPFEVVVVDDGSEEPLETALAGPGGFPLRFVRQVPLGIAAARNLGLREARGEAVLFLDSDCSADPRLLRTLWRCMEAHPEDSAFQVELRGDGGCLVGRLEDMRLRAIQAYARTDDGRIRYANTAAFALRRSVLRRDRDLFDPGYVRGEDTALLAELYRRGQIPRHVTGTRAVHGPGASLPRYVTKHLLVGYYSQEARRVLARTPGALLRASGRLRMLRLMAEAAEGSRERPLRLALVGACYALEIAGRVGHGLFGVRPGRKRLLSVVLDPVREEELVARTCGAACSGRGGTVTYATAWTLVQARHDEGFAARLETFDLVYPDGMGAVLALLLLRLRRSHKVTADDFFLHLTRAAAERGLSIALVGAKEGVVEGVVAAMRAVAPDVEVVYSRSGYFAPGERERVMAELEEAAPNLLFLGMGQPLQERWASELHTVLPGTVIHCVGGLFDLLAGATRRPHPLVRQGGMEWLHRLVARPGHYWRRYLIGLPELAWLMAQDVTLRGLAAISGRSDRFQNTTGRPH